MWIGLNFTLNNGFQIIICALLQELEEEREELARQVAHAQSARQLQEQINEDQQKFIQQQTSQSVNNTPRDTRDIDDPPELSGDNDKLRAELYAIKVTVSPSMLMILHSSFLL